jgi:hypothetical protein
MNATSLTIDISNWPTPLRIQLLEFIDRADAEADNVRPLVAAASTQPADLPEDLGEPSGWNQDAYVEVIKNLLRHHHVQVAVIFEAIKTGNPYVTRDRVYELGNYSADRSLKGFTRPVNRFTADAVEAGLLPEDADDLLAPDYDPSVKGFQRARGFRVPVDVIRMAEEWRAQSEAAKA